MTTWAERAEAREDFERDNHVQIVLTDNERAYLNTIDELRAENARLREQVDTARQAMNRISLQGGNLDDERLTDKTGPNDTVARGLMYVSSREIARDWLSANPAQPNP